MVAKIVLSGGFFFQPPPPPRIFLIFLLMSLKKLYYNVDIFNSTKVNMFAQIKGTFTIIAL